MNQVSATVYSNCKLISVTYVTEASRLLPFDESAEETVFFEQPDGLA